MLKKLKISVKKSEEFIVEEDKKDELFVFEIEFLLMED